MKGFEEYQNKTRIEKTRGHPWAFRVMSIGYETALKLDKSILYLRSS